MGIFYTGNIENFKPDDTDSVMYIDVTWMEDFSVQDLLDRIAQKWGDGVALADVTITSEYIHTRCRRHDVYDPMDYDNFLVITKK